MTTPPSLIRDLGVRSGHQTWQWEIRCIYIYEGLQLGMGKSSINGGFPISTFDDRRVFREIHVRASSDPYFPTSRPRPVTTNGQQSQVWA